MCASLVFRCKSNVRMQVQSSDAAIVCVCVFFLGTPSTGGGRKRAGLGRACHTGITAVPAKTSSRPAYVAAGYPKCEGPATPALLPCLQRQAQGLRTLQRATQVKSEDETSIRRLDTHPKTRQASQERTYTKTGRTNNETTNKLETHPKTTHTSED